MSSNIRNIPFPELAVVAALCDDDVHEIVRVDREPHTGSTRVLVTVRTVRGLERTLHFHAFGVPDGATGSRDLARLDAIWHALADARVAVQRRARDGVTTKTRLESTDEESSER